MAKRIRAGLSPQEGRKFGLLVGGAFLALALIFWWRDHGLAMRIVTGIGGLLVAGGLLIPGRLGPVYDAWMGLALAISKVTTPIFMGIVYFLVLGPLGVARRLFGWNAMRHRPENESYWQDKGNEGTGGLTRQF